MKTRIAFVHLISLGLLALAGCDNRPEVKLFAPAGARDIRMFDQQERVWEVEYVTHPRRHVSYYTTHVEMRAPPRRIQVTFPLRPHVGCAWGPELRATFGGRSLSITPNGAPRTYVSGDRQALVACDYTVAVPST